MSLQVLGDHLWQSTVFAAAVGLLALSLRRNRASVRYWLWLAASVKLLIPFAALMALGSQSHWRSVPFIAQPTVDTISTISQPFSQVDFALVSQGSGPATSALPISTFMSFAWLAGPGTMTGRGRPMPVLASSLSNWVNRVVLDRTGLSGDFDVDLKWAPDQLPQGLKPPGVLPLPPIDPNGPSIFTALQEQLGLKLESTRGPVDVLVIAHVEQPTRIED